MNSNKKGDTENMLKIAICDDEEIFGRHLEKLISGYLDSKGEVYSIRRFLSGVEFTSLGAQMAAYRIVFLDINMMELNGIETARKLRELSDEAYVIFVTAFINYTLEGYKVNAFRYLLKDADNFKESLEECMDIGDKMFLRIHQSFLVNISFVEYIEDKTLFLVDGTSLPIAKSRYKMVQDAVIRFKGVIQ